MIIFFQGLFNTINNLQGKQGISVYPIMINTTLNQKPTQLSSAKNAKYPERDLQREMQSFQGGR